MKKITFPEGGVLYENDYTVKKVIAPGNILEAKEVKIEDLDNPASTQQEPSNLAEIDYVIEGDKVRIVELRNFKSREDICEIYGDEVLYKYFSGKNTMELFSENVIVDIEEYAYRIAVGKIIPQTKFHNVINIMKKAGNRLHDLIKQSKKIRTVKI